MLQLALTLLNPIFALEGEWADFRAVIVVLISFVFLIGSVYMLLWSNFGAKVGYLVLMVSLFGWMILMSMMWLVGLPGTLPGTGPRTHEPRWVPFLQESEQGREFSQVLEAFPGQPWDEPGEVYPGNIDSSGEIENVTSAVQSALALLAQEQGTEATKPSDWDWLLEGEEAITDAQRALPRATIRYYQDGTPLLAGIRIGATDKHPAFTVFAYRDKGATYLTSLYFLIASLLGFIVHTWLLARTERRDDDEDEPAPEREREPATV